MSRTYMERAWKPFDGPAKVAMFFESLSPQEWDELIRDLLAETSEARMLFASRGDSGILPYAATLIGQDDTSAACLCRIQEALSRIFNEEVRHVTPSARRFRKILFLAESLGLSLHVRTDDVGFELESSS